MKKICFLFCAILTIFCGQAQKIEKMTIGDTEFLLRLNLATKTAEIFDYEHKIDDSEYPYFVHSRKIKKLQNKTLVIPAETRLIDGVVYKITSIGEKAFADYTNFTSVKIPETITKIGNYAFFRTSLEGVVLPESVTKIGKRAFGHCKKLKYFAYPETVDSEMDSVCAESKLIAGKPERYPVTKVLQKRDDTPLRNVPDLPDDKNFVSDIDEDIPVTGYSNRNTFALIIANENYKKVPGGQLPKVDYALNDGHSFKRYCEDVLGLPPEFITFIGDASKGQMENAVNEIVEISNLQKRKGKTRFLVYYAGHGMPDKYGETYLMPVDEYKEDRGYSLKHLYAQLGSASAEYVCVFLDACFSGLQRNSEVLPEMTARGIGHAELEKPLSGNMVVFSAAQGNETAHYHKKQRHGLFSYFLMKKLQEDVGDVTLGELSNYIYAEVEDYSSTINKKPQHPSTICSANMANKWMNLKLK